MLKSRVLFPLLIHRPTAAGRALDDHLLGVCEDKTRRRRALRDAATFIAEGRLGARGLVKNSNDKVKRGVPNSCDLACVMIKARAVRAAT